MAREDRQRLDVPTASRRTLRRPDVDPDMFGRFAETFARYMGTASFLAYMTLTIVVWVLWNVFGPDGGQFDVYPFIFLTLVLSLQASYAAPLILLAQNRQEARDRVVQEQDRDATARAHADMQFLAREVASLRHGLGEVATRDFLRSELRSLLTELEALEAQRSDSGADGPAEDAGTGTPERAERPRDPRPR